MAYSLRASASRPLFRASILGASPSLGRIQPFHSSIPVQQTYKDQNASTEHQKQDDRTTLNPRSSEYTQSGYDGDVAEKSDTAFNPKNTTPEGEYAKAGNGNNVLEASAANRDFSKMTDERCEHREDRKDRSVGSKPSRKHGKYMPTGGTKPSMNK